MRMYALAFATGFVSIFMFNAALVVSAKTTWHSIMFTIGTTLGGLLGMWVGGRMR